MAVLPEKTVKYKTFLKSTLQQGLAQVFAAHPDTHLRTRSEGNTTLGTKVTLEWPKTQDRYPAVVIRYFERNIKRMGVGHHEYILLQPDDLVPAKMFHNVFDGDLEFAVYGLSNYDRDLMCDTIVQTLTMGTLEGYTNHLFTTVYGDEDVTPDARWHFITIGSDKISGFGETQTPVPWMAEDEQLYISQYRVPVTGEFYSVPPTDLTDEFVQSVPIYPYIEDLEAQPTGAVDPAEWIVE